jgi:hypothetical protein
MLVYKNKEGEIIEKYENDSENGDVFYNDKKIGTFDIEHDSNLGSYYLIILNNGKEFHDHYFEDKDIIKHLV